MRKEINKNNQLIHNYVVKIFRKINDDRYTSASNNTWYYKAKIPKSRNKQFYNGESRTKIFLQNSQKDNRKHIAIPVKTVSMTTEDEDIFLNEHNEQDNGEISHNTMPTFTNYTTKKISSLTGGTIL